MIMPAGGTRGVRRGAERTRRQVAARRGWDWKREIEAAALARRHGSIAIRCRMYYGPAIRPFMPHGEHGWIVKTSRGKRLVVLESGRVIVCPIWNAQPVTGGV